MTDVDQDCAENGRPPVSSLTAPQARRMPEQVGGTGAAPPALSLPAALTVAFATVLCVLAVIGHVCLVFLHVAPSNAVSQRYQRQTDAWIYPYFEQNWQLFAPNPESVRWQISARTATTAPDGSRRVGEWLDLTAIDDAAVLHSPFPSHTAQNMLRRALSAYLDTQGTGRTPVSERALMLQEYVANIAAQRLAAGAHPAFGAVQLRVVSTPITPPASTAPAAPTPSGASSDTRYLPWWQVKSHDH
ncbi:hypothetical protein P3T37_005639 [Kitasatospora sp. MAA4]|uniref:DUF5819 family protein n=1 Tax=Kitasatospora sp. MAA4 TaxID=3035093 RepID=UPI0024741EF6|nr:DUF5819 family protein [Kitasatospora sp. MAA4]MDH6136220.1 hypothetical protein [Kitasatospora sp. MAA4]